MQGDPLHAWVEACGTLCRNRRAKKENCMMYGTKAFTALRWFALVWLLAWLPIYTWAWGWENMMHVCDIAVILGCFGLWFQSPLLISSQALSSLFAGLLWSLDVGWRLVAGHHLVGGTEYMWDAHYPLGVRLLSTFHIVLPLALIWAIRMLGYQRRALALQSAIMAALLIFSRFLPPALNMNYAYLDPLLHRGWGPGPVHLAVIFVGAVGFLYWPAHLLLSRMFPNGRATARSQVK
jgi:hypothetical protein